jgi:hypothetical protein
MVEVDPVNGELLLLTIAGQVGIFKSMIVELEKYLIAVSPVLESIPI